MTSRMDRLTEWQLVVQGQVRSVEGMFPTLHEDLIDWGRWGRGRDFDKPRISPSGVWLLPGDPDPDRDPNAPPERVSPPINERMVVALDTRIGDLINFPAIYRKILRINYVGARRRNGGYSTLIEWQRPDEARVNADSYCQWLSQAMRLLTVDTRPKFDILRNVVGDVRP